MMAAADEVHLLCFWGAYHFLWEENPEKFESPHVVFSIKEGSKFESPQFVFYK
jgi:hypothetical protein